MKIKPYIISAFSLIVLVYAIYIFWFYFALDYRPSSDPAVWGQLGDYVGGVLNPFLSFISIALLIKSLLLQHQANDDLKMEIASREKTEKLRSFELLFFNLIESQKNLFNSFYIEIPSPGFTSTQIKSVKAVIEIENKISQIREKSDNDSDVTELLNELDSDDQIFGITRAFYIAAKITTEKLSDSNGFSAEDRSTHFKALINFTDFAQLRLIIISMQFLDYESARYLRSSKEFMDILKELGLDCNPY